MNPHVLVEHSWPCLLRPGPCADLMTDDQCDEPIVMAKVHRPQVVSVDLADCVVDLSETGIWPRRRFPSNQLDTTMDECSTEPAGTIMQHSHRGGYQNSGNTCYLAAMIHGLLASPSILRTIVEHSCCVECATPCPCSTLQVSELVTRGGRTGTLTIWRPLAEMWGFEWGRQHSVHELLFHITTNLDTTSLGMIVATHTRSLCSCGAAVTVNTVPENIFELKMEDVDERGSLAVGLDGLKHWHTVRDASYKCDCGQIGRFYERRLDITGTGDTFVVALTRERAFFGKSKAIVRVDDELTIDARAWRLRAAVVHRGDRSDGGHYVAYIRDNDRGFMLFNDAEPPEFSRCLPDEVHTDGVVFVYCATDSDPADVDCSAGLCAGTGLEDVASASVSELAATSLLQSQPTLHRRKCERDARAGRKSGKVISSTKKGDSASTPMSVPVKREKSDGPVSVSTGVESEHHMFAKKHGYWITPDQKERVIQRYADGASYKDIAEDEGLSKNSVRRTTIKADPDRCPKPGTVDHKLSPSGKITRERADWRRTVAVSDNETTQGRVVTAEQHEYMKSLYAAGVHRQAIASEMGITWAQVKRYTQIEPTDTAECIVEEAARTGRRRKVAELKNTVSPGKLAAEVGVSTQTLANWKPRERRRTAHEAWASEASNIFSVTEVIYPVRLPNLEVDNQGPLSELSWIAHASWTFCPRCGRRRMGKLAHEGTRWSDMLSRAVEQRCKPSCDFSPAVLEEPMSKKGQKRQSKFYVTPNIDDWPRVILNADGTPALDERERASLSLILLDATYSIVRGNRAPVTSKKKIAVIKATWREDDVEAGLPTERARAAFHWLLEHNEVYANYLKNQKRARADRDGSDRSWRVIPTALLLLQMPGVEVAARPWLYPTPAFGDTDHRVRLPKLERMEAGQCPSVKNSFYHKLLSRCQSYQKDFALQCLLYDTFLARRISSVVSLAKEQQRAPDDLAQDMQNFHTYWLNERAKLEDVCRQRGKPNLFFTVAPAEWKFPVHEGMLHRVRQAGSKAMTDAQSIMTLHMYNCFVQFVERVLVEGAASNHETGIDKINEYSLRFEFQGRGTLHVHVVAWVDIAKGLHSEEDTARRLSGKTGQQHNSKLVAYLERAFKGSVDVQVGKGDICLLRYVTGYVAKASDALQFKTREADAGNSWDKASWRQIYRMMCKKAPLEPEIVMELAGVPQMVSSYRGEVLFAPVPGNKSVMNRSRHLYNAYQLEMQELEKPELQPYIEWARVHKVTVVQPDREGEPVRYKVSKRGEWGRGKNKATCALGLRFPWERLDIFIGAWCAMFIPHSDESEFVLSDEDAASTPEGTHYLKAALQHAYFRDRESPVQALIDKITDDLELRGISRDNCLTFAARLHACERLLDATARGIVDPRSWRAKRPTDMPTRTWSVQQQQVLDTVSDGLSVADANVEVNSRYLHVTGGPGTGKTEVIVQCAVNAAARDDARVLIGCPVGSLLDTYRLRLPPKLDIVVETIHSAFRVTRKADEIYVPPGRLRMYDLIIFDEVSQIDPHVWNEVSQALAELIPGPVVVLVGDFQQLQPVERGQGLRERLNTSIREGGLRRIELLQHEFARCRDNVMIEFLNWIRFHQPSMSTLLWFFGKNGFMPKSPWAATGYAISRERATTPQRPFTFLTVSNDTAAMLNRARIDRDYPHCWDGAENDYADGDQKAGGGKLVFQPGMRVRLTRNVAKDRGFVNGALGEVEHVLRRGGSRTVFVMKATNDVRILVHSFTTGGVTFMPVSYAYAMTVRRAQGMTLDMVGLRFDRRNPDGGYAYVGASRVRRRCDLYHVGRLRRTD